MNVIEQEVGPVSEPDDLRIICKKATEYPGYRKEPCPDCGATLWMNGRCRFCPSCGWSTC